MKQGNLSTTLTIGLVLALLLCGADLVVRAYSLSLDSTVALGYLKLLLSPWSLAALIALIMLKPNIASLLDRLEFVGSKYTLAGFRPQPNPSSSDKTLPPDSQEEQQELKSLIQDLLNSQEKTTPPNTPALTEEDAQKIEHLLNAERNRAAYWEFSYLEHFLLPYTKSVLATLAGAQRAGSPYTSLLLDTDMRGVPPHERDAILSALEYHHLIRYNGELIDVTPKGYEFLAWRTPTPKAANQ